MAYKNPIPELWEDEKSTKVTVTLTFKSDVPVTREEAARDLNARLNLDCIRPEHIKLGPIKMRRA